MLSTTTVTPPPSLAVDPCPLNVPTEVSALVPAAGETRTIDVITGATCTWTAESRAAFITITSASTGQGSGTVTVSVQPNTGAQRSGSLVVNQLTVTVTQAAAPCAFALSSTSQSFDADGGTGTVGVTVTQGADCQWTATSNSPFITVTSGSAGTGAGSVTFRVASNDGAARSGTLAIAGMTFTVMQAALPPEPPQTFDLVIAGYVRPWCASSFAIQSDPPPNYPSPSAPGSFQTLRKVVVGTNVELRASGAGSIVEWTDCDSTSETTCRVTMNSNRVIQAEVAESCATPSFSAVSRTNVSGNWIVNFTAVNLLPFAGSSFGGVTFTASCSGYSTSMTVPSQSSGTISSSIMVPTASCMTGGTLSLTDFNGTASTSW